MWGEPEQVRLWWAWSEDHAGDAYVLARSERQATAMLEVDRGLPRMSTHAKLVADAPPQLEPGFPDERVLSACGVRGRDGR